MPTQCLLTVDHRKNWRDSARQLGQNARAVHSAAATDRRMGRDRSDARIYQPTGHDLTSESSYHERGSMAQVGPWLNRVGLLPAAGEWPKRPPYRAVIDTGRRPGRAAGLYVLACGHISWVFSRREPKSLPCDKCQDSLDCCYGWRVTRQRV
jgi:hypothetical protein